MNHTNLPGTPCNRYPRRNGIPACRQIWFQRYAISRTSFSIPGKRNWRSYNNLILKAHSPILRAQEVFAISQKHIFDAWLQHNRTHRALLTSSIPTPTAVSPWNGMRFVCTLMIRLDSRIGHKNMDAMFGILLILALRLENEFLQNVIVASNHAAGR